MALNKDFEELLHHFNAVKAKYLIVGAYAVIHYTEPRYTKALDIWVAPTPENARRIYEALKQFGAPLKDVEEGDLANPSLVYRMGIPPNQIDIMMQVTGLRFDTAWRRRKRAAYGPEKVYILNRDDVIKAKEAAGRPQDLIDATKVKHAKQMFGKRKKKVRT